MSSARDGDARPAEPAGGDAVNVGGSKERVRETETWLGRCTSSPG